MRLTVKVHGSGPVGVDLVDHLVQFFVGHVVVQLGQYLPQHFGCYVTVSCPKSFVFNIARTSDGVSRRTRDRARLPSGTRDALADRSFYEFSPSLSYSRNASLSSVFIASESSSSSVMNFAASVQKSSNDRVPVPVKIPTENNTD